MLQLKRKPPYWKPPKDECDICGSTLYRRTRYKVWVYYKLKGIYVPVTTLYVCSKCLEKLLYSAKGTNYKIKYDKARPLGV